MIRGLLKWSMQDQCRVGQGSYNGNQNDMAAKWLSRSVSKKTGEGEFSNNLQILPGREVKREELWTKTANAAKGARLWDGERFGKDTGWVSNWSWWANSKSWECHGTNPLHFFLHSAWTSINGHGRSVPESSRPLRSGTYLLCWI
jgi:hypothetical protein